MTVILVILCAIERVITHCQLQAVMVFGIPAKVVNGLVQVEAVHSVSNEDIRAAYRVVLSADTYIRTR